MIYLWTSAIFLYLKLCSAKLTIPEQDISFGDNIVNAAAEIANENFNFRKLTVFLARDVSEDFQDKFLQLYEGSVVIEVKREGPTGQVIVLVDSFKSFMKILSKLKPDLKGKTLLGSGAKFLIVLMRSASRMSHITKILWHYQVVNVIILTNEKNKTALYTYFPYKDHFHCQNTEPQFIGYWGDKSTKGKELYVDKMKNMKGCPLYVSSNKLYHPATEQKVPLEIVKKALLRLLRDAMNFTPIVTTRDYVSIDSDRAKNWSDSLNDVISGVANVSTCNIPLGIDRLGLLDYSMPYIRVRLAWLAPPVSPGPVWYRLLSPLNGYLWLILLVLLFFITSLPFMLKFKVVKRFCFRYFKNSNKLRSVAIRIWGVLLGQPVRVAPRRFRDFYILSLWIWFTFVIRSAYQSVLIGALKTDTLTGAFTDLTDASDEGYKFGGRAGVYGYFEHDPLIRERFEIIKEKDFESIFHDVVENRQKFVIATSLEYAWAYCLSQGRKEMECGHVVPESIMTLPLVIWMRIYSPFKRPLHMWVPRLIETGLLERESTVKPVCCLTKSTDPSALTLHQTLSCILCLILGYSISAAILMLEILRHKTNKLKARYLLGMRFDFKSPYKFQN